ncbi:MAG TPA: hypothetical protein DD803_09265 [Alcaligenes faecalis]|nr:hypothetical protein [Alcaligenes faecalis]
MQPSNQPTNQPSIHPVSQSVSQSASQSADPSTDDYLGKEFPLLSIWRGSYQRVGGDELTNFCEENSGQSMFCSVEG